MLLSPFSHPLLPAPVPWSPPLSVPISLLSMSALVLLPKFKDHLRLLPYFSPVINSCLHCLQNAPRAWPIPLFTYCSSSNQDTITSALDLSVAFQLITLFSFLPPTSNLATYNHSNLQKASVFLLTKHSKASHWLQNKMPSLTMVYKACPGQIPVFYLIPLYPWDIPLSTVHCTPAHWHSLPPSNMPLLPAYLEYSSYRLSYHHWGYVWETFPSLSS